MDEFLRLMGEHYEVIISVLNHIFQNVTNRLYRSLVPLRLRRQVLIYTASLSKYADPLLDELDISKVKY